MIIFVTTYCQMNHQTCNYLFPPKNFPNLGCRLIQRRFLSCKEYALLSVLNTSSSISIIPGTATVGINYAESTFHAEYSNFINVGDFFPCQEEQKQSFSVLYNFYFNIRGPKTQRVNNYNHHLLLMTAPFTLCEPNG